MRRRRAIGRMPAIALGAVAALAVALVAPHPACADELQCEGRLVGYGASIDEVLQLCGEPVRRVRTARILYGGLEDSPYSGETRVPVEVWTYSNPGEFTRRLVFVDGRLEKVETGGYADLE